MDIRKTKAQRRHSLFGKRSRIRLRKPCRGSRCRSERGAGRRRSMLEALHRLNDILAKDLQRSHSVDVVDV
jgi:hypothetical protein